MKTTNLGYPRIGAKRELKHATERFWKGEISKNELLTEGKQIRINNWKLQEELGIDLIPSNDFSFYDHVLDMALVLGCVPERYQELQNDKDYDLLDLTFAMARGLQNEVYDLAAMEMTKWFDTNYHYIVPEFEENQKFQILSNKIVSDFLDAKELGIHTKPVVIGPVSFLLLGKVKGRAFSRLDLLDKLMIVYGKLFNELSDVGATEIQLDEPVLNGDLSRVEFELLRDVLHEFVANHPHLKFHLTNYFGNYGVYLPEILKLPIDALHLDLKRDPKLLMDVLSNYEVGSSIKLILGIVDGRNVWKNDFVNSFDYIQKALDFVGEEKVLIGPSCSLIHVPCDLDSESGYIDEGIKQWLSFAKQKLQEIVDLRNLVNTNSEEPLLQVRLSENIRANHQRSISVLVHNKSVQARVSDLQPEDSSRDSDFSLRKIVQANKLGLPLYPTTTIGSFPQTKEVRSWRANFRKGNIDKKQYDQLIAKEIDDAIHFQEQCGLDVLVHGEFERNDMVEYFGELLDGFVFSKFGWVQSYGTRCVKPPIIYGDVYRPKAMTVEWSAYAQEQTDSWVKGMLTGPVTILQWSFVRDDQERSETCNQIALAIRDEVLDLESAGLKIIQIDEPAIREGLPLRRSDWEVYLNWAVKAFRISASGVRDSTQIHTHMCYSEFNDIIKSIADLDADVITIECSRSQMELLDVFSEFKYPNEIGPGVYDIHSPRVPSSGEMIVLMNKASAYIPEDRLWVNPDCGLKTRDWPETKAALISMVETAKYLRSKVAVATTV